jgi:hypothetical protein
MRTTVTIDDDLLAAARSLAQAESVSVGKAISALARRGLEATPRVRKGRGGAGFPTFSVPQGAHPITLEDVRKAEDEP